MKGTKVYVFPNNAFLVAEKTIWNDILISTRIRISHVNLPNFKPLNFLLLLFFFARGAFLHSPRSRLVPKAAGNEGCL